MSGKDDRIRSSENAEQFSEGCRMVKWPPRQGDKARRKAPRLKYCVHGNPAGSLCRKCGGVVK